MAINHAVKNKILERDLYTGSLSSLKELTDSTTHYEVVVTEIKNLLLKNIRVFLHRIKAHVGHAHNESVDALAKDATRGANVDINEEYSQDKLGELAYTDSINHWKIRWDDFTKGRSVHNTFPKVSDKRLQADFSPNHALTGHGSFASRQNRLFNKNPNGICGKPADVDHYIYNCTHFGNISKAQFPDNYGNIDGSTLCMDFYAKKG